MLFKSVRGAIALAGCVSLFLFGLSSPANAEGFGPVGTEYIVRIDPAGNQSGSALGAQISAPYPNGVRDLVIPQTWNNTSGQKWKMKIVGYDDPNGWATVTFQNLRYSGICLDKSMDTSSSMNVYLFTCNGGVNQRWYMVRMGDIQYSLGKFQPMNRENWGCLTSRYGIAETSPCEYDGYNDYALYLV